MLLPETICDNVNTTNTTSLLLDYTLPKLHILVAGVVVFIVILPFVLFQFSAFPIGTTSAVLLGATLMVITGVVTQEEVYEVIGHQDNLTTIFLLLGMMLLAQYFDREQLLTKLLRHFLLPHFTFENYIWRVCLLSFVLSAFFTNDACCAVLTPLLLKFWEVQERPRTELETILLGIATSANLGSVITIFGNPQLALIAARTDSLLYSSSRFDLRTCLMFMLLPATLGFFINLGFLILHHRIRTRNIEKSKLISEQTLSEQEMAGLTKDPCRNNLVLSPEHTNGTIHTENEETTYDALGPHPSTLAPPSLETIQEDEILEIEPSPPTDEHELTFSDQEDESEVRGDGSGSDSDQYTSLKRENNLSQFSQNMESLDSMEFRPSQLLSQTISEGGRERGNFASQNTSFERHGLRLSQKLGIYRSLSYVSAAEFLPMEAGTQSLNGDIAEVYSPSDSVPFQTVISFLLVLVIVLFLASSSSVKFDMGLVPMGAAVLAITADAILNRQSALLVIRRVDWSIILMFFGIFVWLHGFNKTRIPRWIWAKIGLANSSFNSPLSIVIFSTFILIGSNIFSNVPLTLIVLEQLEPCKNQLNFVIYLAWVTTVSGNLTLFGSVANLIVAQKGLQTLNYRLTFLGYLKYGLITTLIILIVGTIILYGLLLVV